MHRASAYVSNRTGADATGYFSGMYQPATGWNIATGGTDLWRRISSSRRPQPLGGTGKPLGSDHRPLSSEPYSRSADVNGGFNSVDRGKLHEGTPFQETAASSGQGGSRRAGGSSHYDQDCRSNYSRGSNR